MTWNVKTIVALVVSLATLAASYASGFFAAHPDVTAALVGVEQILSALLPSATSTAAKAPVL